MAFKFITIISMLALANAGLLNSVHYTATPIAHKVTAAYANPAVDSVASTHQNVVRSFDGTVSTYSKAVDTPYSSVRKTDTRISNNVYQPAIQKTLTYAAAPVAKTITYAAAPIVEKTKTITFAAPAPANTVTYAAAPVVQKPIVSYAAPVTKTYLAPVHRPTVYAHPEHAHAAHVPAVYGNAVPATTSYNHGPAATTYTHNAPGVSGYGSSQTVHYSPAEMVSHMSFDGFGTHWGY